MSGGCERGRGGQQAMLMRRRHKFVTVAALFSLFGVALVGPRGHVAANTLPKQIGDRAFWRMIVDFSEPGGLFPSDNFISNETTYQEVIPELRKRASSDGAYLGVGPDQNFTYITALRPRIAFIIDIRRQNMIEHLLYKAIVEISDDRDDFLPRLFPPPRPASLGRSSAPEVLFGAYHDATAS